MARIHEDHPAPPGAIHHNDSVVPEISIGQIPIPPASLTRQAHIENPAPTARAMFGEDHGGVTQEHNRPGFMTGISLLLPITLTTMAIVLLTPVVPDLMTRFSGVRNHEYWVPMILTIPALCSALLCPFAGMLGDYFGRRRLLLVAFVAYAVLGVAPAMLDDLTQFLSPLVVTFASARNGGLLGAFAMLSIGAIGGVIVALLAGRQSMVAAHG